MPGPFEDVVSPGTFDYWADLGRRMGERQVAERRARDPNYAFNVEVLGGREPPGGIDRVGQETPTPPPPPPSPAPPRTPTPAPPTPPQTGLQLPGFPSPQDLMRQIMSMILMENLRKFFGGGLPSPSQFIPGGPDNLPRTLPVYGIGLPMIPGPGPGGAAPVPPGRPGPLPPVGTDLPNVYVAFQPKVPTTGEITQGPMGLPWGPMGAGNAMWSFLSQFFMPKSPDRAYAWV